MTSNVIINFGTNASQAFRTMATVKKEMATVQAKAASATAAVTASTRRMGFQAFMPAFALSGAGRLGGLFSVGARFGLAGAGAAAGLGAVFATFGKMAEGFRETAEKYPMFQQAIETVTTALVSLGSSIANNVIPVLQNLAVDTGLVESPYGAITPKQQAAFDQRMVEVKRREADELAAKRLEQQKKSDAIAKKQLEYVRETAFTLRRMENDMERMNQLDPW